MSEGKKSRLIKYAVGFGVCGAMALLYLYFHELDNLSAADRYRVLCDAFTVPGMLSILVGALLAVANEGAFNGVGYAVSIAVKALIPGGRNSMESYSDYLERKDGKKVTGFGFLFVVGGVFMVIALVFLMLFHQNFQ